MILIRANAQSEAGEIPDPRIFEAMGRFNDELVKAGVLLAAEGLRPSSDGKRIQWNNGTKTVIDGPFAETKELIAGFWMIQTKTAEEALAWANRVPNPMNVDGQIELRRIGEMEDFLADMNGGPRPA
jgi:hypothetical protein